MSQCVICINPLLAEEEDEEIELATLICGHVFHNKCINICMQSACSLCPKCRHPSKKKVILLKLVPVPYHESVFTIPDTQGNMEDDLCPESKRIYDDIKVQTGEVQRLGAKDEEITRHLNQLQERKNSLAEEMEEYKSRIEDNLRLKQEYQERVEHDEAKLKNLVALREDKKMNPLIVDEFLRCVAENDSALRKEAAEAAKMDPAKRKKFMQHIHDSIVEIEKTRKERQQQLRAKRRRFREDQEEVNSRLQKMEREWEKMCERARKVGIDDPEDFLKNRESKRPRPKIMASPSSLKRRRSGGGLLPEFDDTMASMLNESVLEKSSMRPQQNPAPTPSASSRQVNTKSSSAASLHDDRGFREGKLFCDAFACPSPLKTKATRGARAKTKPANNTNSASNNAAGKLNVPSSSSSSTCTSPSKKKPTLLERMLSRGYSLDGVSRHSTTKDSTSSSAMRKDGEKINDHTPTTTTTPKDTSMKKLLEKSAPTRTTTPTGTMANTPAKGKLTVTKSGKFLSQEEEEDEFLSQESVERALRHLTEKGGILHGVTGPSSIRSSPIRKKTQREEEITRGSSKKNSIEDIRGKDDIEESIDDYVDIDDDDMQSLPGSCGQNFSQDAYQDIGIEYDEKIDEDEDLFGERKDFEMSGADDIFQNSVSSPAAEKKDETTKSTRDIEKFDAGFMTKVYSVSDPEKTSKQRKAYYRLFE